MHNVCGSRYIASETTTETLTLDPVSSDSMIVATPADGSSAEQRTIMEAEPSDRPPEYRLRLVKRNHRVLDRPQSATFPSVRNVLEAERHQNTR